MNRRDALKTIGLGTLAGGLGHLGLATAQSSATNPTILPNGAGYYRLELGSFKVYALLDNQSTDFDALPFFGANPDRQAVYEQALRDRFIPLKRTLASFTPVLVDTGSRKVLIDTGFGARLVPALRAAGFKPEDIDTVFFSHLHFDHISGATDQSGRLTFPNARLVTNDTEFQYWTNPDVLERFSKNEQTAGFIPSVLRNVVSLKERYTLIKNNAEIVSGVTTIATPGHTPGHQAVSIQSGQAQLILSVDSALNPLISLEFPESYAQFDSDPQAGIASRKRLFGRIASEEALVLGYHFPWPGFGRVRQRGAAFEFVAVPLAY